MKISSINKGLVAHCPLDVASLRGSLGLADKTPNSNHGVSANAPVFTTDRKGQANRAMSFDGVSDYVDVGNGTNFNFGTGDFSVSAWVKSGLVNSAYHIILDHGYNDGDTRYRIAQTSNDKLEFNVGNVLLATADDVVVDTWYYITGVRIGDAFYIYVDGDLKNTGSGVSAKSISPTDDLTIGQRSDQTGNSPFNGSMADVRIYNRAISSQEITTLYESYRPKLAISSLQKGLVLDMPLTSKRYDAGNTLFKDLTPYENVGANTGGDVDVDHTTFVSANEDVVRIADNASLSPTSTMSSFIWVKGEGQTNKYFLDHWDNPIDQRAYGMLVSNISPYTYFAVVISDDGTFEVHSAKHYGSSMTVFDNAWHFVGFTFNAGTLKLYIDGVEDTNPTKHKDGGITTIHNSTADVIVGSRIASDTPVDFFNGDLSGAKIWNRALDSQEILLLYEKGRN